MLLGVLLEFRLEVLKHRDVTRSSRPLNCARTEGRLVEMRCVYLLS